MRQKKFNEEMANFLSKMGATDFLHQLLKKIEMQPFKELAKIKSATY
jgi:hypothetical protein